MAVDYDVTTSSDVNKLWKKVQTKLQQGRSFYCPETDWVDEMEPLAVDFSLREVTAPIDLNFGYGVGAISEGGSEVIPSSVNAEEITIPITELEKRFTISTRSAMLQSNPGAVIQKQMVFQGRKAMEALGIDLADRFYGFRLGYLAQTSTNATQSSGAYTLSSLYGVSNIGSGAQMAQKFKVGDRVSLIRSGAIVANSGSGEITAVTPGTPSITVTWGGSVDSDANDYIVKHQAVNDTTITGSDYNQSIVGLLDACTSTSVHGLSSSSAPEWTPAYSSTSSGRFSGAKWVAAKQAIVNNGGQNPRIITVMGQDIYRDMIALHQASLRYSDPTTMEIIGDIKVEGDRVKSSERSPEKSVILYDRSAYRRVKLPSDHVTSLGQAIRMQDTAGYVCPLIDLRSHVVVARRKFAYFTNLTTG